MAADESNKQEQITEINSSCNKNRSNEISTIFQERNAQAIDQLQDSLDNANKQNSKKDKIQIILSLVLLMISNMFVSAGRNAMMTSLTTLITDRTLATIALTVTSSSQFVASFLLLTPLATAIRLKYMIIFAMSISSLQIFAYFDTSKWTLFLIGSVGCGSGTSMLYSVCLAYCNYLAYWYHKIAGGNLEIILLFMADVANACITSGILWGNVAVYTVFEARHANKSTINTTFIDMTCGVNYCNQDLSVMSAIVPPSPAKYYLLLTIFTVLAVVGCILSCFIYGDVEKMSFKVAEPVRSFIDNIKAMIYFSKDWKVLVLSLISFYIGFLQSFATAEFTMAFVSCPFGISAEGFAVMVIGIPMFVLPLVHWSIMKYIGRLPLFVFAWFLVIVTIICFLMIPMNHYSHALLYCLSMIFGIGYTSYMGLTLYLYGLLFKNDLKTANASANFWRCTGLIVNYSFFTVLCMRMKLYIILSLGILAIICYIPLEIYICRSFQKQTSH